MWTFRPKYHCLPIFEARAPDRAFAPCSGRWQRRDQRRVDDGAAARQRTTRFEIRSNRHEDRYRQFVTLIS